MTHGLPGVGKTTAAMELSRRGVGVYLSNSQIRSKQSGPNTLEMRLKTWPRVYAELFRRLESELALGQSVVLDGTFGRRWQRTSVYSICERFGVPTLIIALHCDERIIHERIEADMRSRSVKVEGRTLADYEYQVATWEPITADELSSACVDIIDADTVSCVVSGRTDMSLHSGTLMDAVLACLESARDAHLI
jgi:hypothetical protein